MAIYVFLVLSIFIIIEALIISTALYYLSRCQKRESIQFLEPRFIIAFTALFVFGDYLSRNSFDINVSLIWSFALASLVSVFTPIISKYFPYEIDHR